MKLFVLCWALLWMCILFLVWAIINTVPAYIETMIIIVALIFLIPACAGILLDTFRT